MAKKTDTQNVLSYADWQKLCEVAVPTLHSDRELGEVLAVKKVGFLALNREDCEGENIRANGKCILPTALLEGESLIRRLPPELGEWALSCVALARAGRLKFPCNVEFGRLNGRAYANFV
jgi:hypothetical protein